MYTKAHMSSLANRAGLAAAVLLLVTRAFSGPPDQGHPSQLPGLFTGSSLFIVLCTSPKIALGKGHQPPDTTVWNSYTEALKTQAPKKGLFMDCSVARMSNPALLESHPVSPDTPNKRLYCPKPNVELKTKNGVPRCVLFLGGLKMSEKSDKGLHTLTVETLYTVWDTKTSSAKRYGEVSDYVIYSKLTQSDLDGLAGKLLDHAFEHLTLE
jgi:hypothetical protein